MAAKKPAGYVQFSKRLALFVAIFWALTRVASAVLLAIYPGMSAAYLTLQEGADNIMIFSLGCYCGNSVAEKGILNFFRSKTQTTDTDTTSEG